MAKKLSEKAKKDQALELVLSRFQASQKYTQSYFTRFQGYYELYRSYLQKGRLPWRSNLFIPKVFEIVETLAPRIAQAQRTFTVLPVEGMDDDNAEAYADLLKFQFQQTDMESVVEELVKETLIYGTGVMKVGWMNGRPNPETVDIFDFFPDPKARRDVEMKYVIHRVERDIDDIEKNPNYDKDAIAELKKDGQGSGDSNPERKAREGVIGANSQDGTRKRFEVLEYHGEFNGQLALITVAGGKLLRLDEKSPYEFIPFVVVNDHTVPHELYGIGEIEPTESLQNELNDIRNQRMDNVKININKMWKVVAGGVQFEDELVSRPGGIVHLTRADGLQEDTRQPLQSEAFTEESIIKSDMERTTGASSATAGALVSPMGGTQGGVLNRTATGYQGAINQADKRFSAKIGNVKRGLTRVGKMFLWLDQKFMTKAQKIRVVGEDGQFMQDILPEDIKSDFDLIVDIEYLDEFQQAQNDLQLLQALGSIPGINAAAFAADILSKTKKNVKKYLGDPPPPPREQPKIIYQMRGDMAPDAVAQILDKTEGIKSNPELVGSQMRAVEAEEASAKADVADTVASAQESLQTEEPTE